MYVRPEVFPQSFALLLPAITIQVPADKPVHTTDRNPKFLCQIDCTFTCQIASNNFLVSICFERWNIADWFCRERLILYNSRKMIATAREGLAEHINIIVIVTLIYHRLPSLRAICTLSDCLR